MHECVKQPGGMGIKTEQMRAAEKAMLSSDIHTVWSIITDVEHCTWRSDLRKTEVLNEKQFVEYTKEGYATTFTITVKEPYRRWEFDMEKQHERTLDWHFG